MKRKLILLSVLSLMTFLLSGCIFWGVTGTMGTPWDSVLFALRPLMVTVTTRITAMGTVTQVDTIAIGNHTFECLACILPAKSF